MLAGEVYPHVTTRRCPVCQTCEPREFCTHAGVPFVRCGACGSLYQAGEPDWARIAQIYQVLEHIDPPQGALATIHRLLRPGGLVLIVTPDGGSLGARLLKARWPHLFVEHVLLFSRRGLRGCLEMAGFQVERMGFAWKRINLDMLVRHATIHPHVAGSAALRVLGRLLPGPLLRLGIPFNSGEFYVVARRPRTGVLPHR